MSLWQFQAAIGGFAAFHGGDKDVLEKEDAERLAATFKQVRGL